jgi:hypothetical protein
MDAGDGMGERRLSSPALADERDEVTGFNREV